MPNKLKWLCLCLAGITFLSLAGCGIGGPALNIADPQINAVWPAAPAKPRIRLLRILTGESDLVDNKSQKSRLFRWLTGDMAEGAPFVSPYAVATNGRGVIWVTDPGIGGVHRLDLERRHSELWTLADGVPFRAPTGICYDSQRRRLYIADSVANRVVALGDDGKFLFEIKTKTAFGRPGGLALDPAGKLLVADVLQGLVRRFTPDGVELSSLGSPTTNDGHFNRPVAVACDDKGLIYVLDSFNFRVEVLTPDGSAVASIGELGDQPGMLSRPRGIAVDSFGHIYIADAAFDNIQIFNLKGQLLLVFGGGGKYGLSLPAGLTADASDRIYAVDSFNHRIQIYQYVDSGK